jgi:hypothetical protein
MAWYYMYCLPPPLLQIQMSAFDIDLVHAQSCCCWYGTVWYGTVRYGVVVVFYHMQSFCREKEIKSLHKRRAREVCVILSSETSSGFITWIYEDLSRYRITKDRSEFNKFWSRDNNVACHDVLMVTCLHGNSHSVLCRFI